MNQLRVMSFASFLILLCAAVPSVFVGQDFPEYWAAARVLAVGGNPYDGAALLDVQRTLAEQHGTELPNKAVSLWTPPWTLPLYAPLGFFPVKLALLLWLTVQIFCLVLATEWLGETYRLTGWQRWWLHGLACLSAPAFWLLVFGQNTALLLLGLAGFLKYRSARPLVAGLFACLTAIKPHLLAPLGVLLVLDVLRPGGWRTLLGGVATLVLLSAVAIGLKPTCVSDFAEALARPATAETVPLADWELPLLAYKFRYSVAPQQFHWQYLPCVLCMAAWVVVYLRYRTRWNWPHALPLVVLSGAAFAPYGGWIFDLVILVVPIAWGLSAARQRLITLVAFTVGLLLVSLRMLYVGSLGEAIAYTPAVAVLCIAVWVLQLKPKHHTQNPTELALPAPTGVSLP